MSADAQQGSAPSYHDSVREMMRELKSKGGSKGSNAAKVVANIEEEKTDKIILVKIFVIKAFSDLK